jgi:hypothetical protein
MGMLPVALTLSMPVGQELHDLIDCGRGVLCLEHDVPAGLPRGLRPPRIGLVAVSARRTRARSPRHTVPATRATTATSESQQVVAGERREPSQIRVHRRNDQWLHHWRHPRSVPVLTGSVVVLGCSGELKLPGRSRGVVDGFNPPRQSELCPDWGARICRIQRPPGPNRYGRSMARVLVTGMSGAGKTTVLDELRRRGHLAVDTDYDGWKLPDGTWNEPRMDQLLARHQDVIVSGTADNQGRFYDRFHHVVLLSAPLHVLVERVTGRTNNPTARPRSSRPRSPGTYVPSNHCYAEEPQSNWTDSDQYPNWPTPSRI